MNKNILYNNLLLDSDEIDCIFHALIKNYITFENIIDQKAFENLNISNQEKKFHVKRLKDEMKTILTVWDKLQIYINDDNQYRDFYKMKDLVNNNVEQLTKKGN